MKVDFQQVLKKLNAEYSEIRLEKYDKTSISYGKEGFSKVLESSLGGGNVRVLKNGGWGFVSFNSIEQIEESANKALHLAKIVAEKVEQPVKLATVPTVVAKVEAAIVNDPRKIPLAKKAELVKHYGELCLNYNESIANSSVDYYDKFKRVFLFTSEGTTLEMEKMEVRLIGKINALKEGKVESQYVSFSSSSDYNAVLNKDKDFLEKCDKALLFVNAETVQPGVYTTVIGPSLTGIFIHEAFGHLSEGDRIYKNPELKNIMVIGRDFGHPCLSVFDSGIDVGELGFIPYDDEGVKTEKTYIIKEGKLVGRMHSRETAAAMGERPTGSARAVDHKFPPVCRMRNTCIDKGESTLEDMLKGIDVGIYMDRTAGGQTDGEMFTFFPGEAYMIRKGKIEEPVRGVSLAGNVFTTMKNIDMVGNDLQTFGGTCGKGIQFPLPVNTGGPHIRILSLVVGGAK
jgi:TldD protein